MSKQCYFFKNMVKGALEDDTFCTLWELLESWISQNDWMAIFFIILLGIIFEIVLIKIYTSFQKTPALSEKSSSNTQESEDSSPQSMTFDNYSVHSSSEERVDHSSQRMSSSLTSEENEDNFEDIVPLADEITRAGTSENKYQVSHLNESYMSYSNGSSSSLFHSEIKEVLLSQRGSPENEEHTIQYSSKKLFSIMKTNKNKTFMFSSDFNFSRTSRISSESEDLAPCPPAHLFLSRDQVRLLEENVRHQIPLNPKAPSDSSKDKDIYLYSSAQESLIQNHYTAQMNISAQTQDSSPGQNVTQNQSVYDAQLTSQLQLVHNQEVIDGQRDREVSSFALPQNLQRKPLSRSTQDSTQVHVVARSQHLVKDACSVETQDSIKIIESDKHLHEAQCSKSLKDSDRKEDLLQRQNAFLKNARHLVLTLIPNAVAEGTPQLQSIKRKIQEQIASSEFSQYSVPDPVPVLPERQKKHRKILHSKSKCSVKVPPEQPKKAASSQAQQTTVGGTLEHSKLGCNYSIRKKKELYQRKETSGKALPLTYVSKPVAPYIKKHSRKNLLEVMPDLQVCAHFLLKRDKSVGAEVNYAGSIEKRDTSDDTKNRKQQSKDNKGLKTIPPKISPQLEQSFVVNTFQLKASCSSSVETNWNNKESLKGPVTQVKGIGIAEFLKALKSKGTCDLCIPKHPTPLAETASEPRQGFVSPSNMKSNRRLKTQEDQRSPEKPHPPLSDTEKVPTSPPERSFPKGNTQCKTLKIVLESPDANLLISLETKMHDSCEQSAGTDIKENTGNVIWKKEKPLRFHITGYGDPDESEGLEYNRANMGAQGVSGAPHRTAHTATGRPPDGKMPSRFKSKTEASRIADFSHSVVRQEELSDEKISTAKYIEKKRVSKKPQGHDEEEEEQVLQEAALMQTEDLRLSLELKLQGKYVKFEIEQSNSGNKKTQNKEQTAQPQTVSTQTMWETSPCPAAGLFQVEKVKLSADRPTGRESADPEIPLPEPEKLPVGESSMETFESCVPFNEDPKKIAGHIAEEKQHLKRVFPSVTLGSFISHMLHSSYLKRQNIRKTLPGTQSIFSPQRVVMKAKKSAILLMSFGNRRGVASHRKRSRDNLKVIIKKQKQQDETVPDVLPNVIYPHKSVSPRTRMQGLNTENHILTKLQLEKPQVEKEEQSSGFMMKEGDARNRSEAKLQNEVRGNETAPSETAFPDPWDPQSDGYPETDFQSGEELHRPVPARAVTGEPTDSPITEPAHGEQRRLMTQGDLRWAADSETPPSPAASLTGDTLKQTRESDGPSYKSDTRDMGHFFAERDLPEHLPATSAETSGCHASTASHSKVKKNRVRFSHAECSVEPKSAHTKSAHASMPQVCNIQGRKEKLESYFQTRCGKIIQANGMVYEFLNTLYSAGPGRLQRDGVGHPQLIGGELAVHERRPQYVDFFANMKNAFSDREEKVQDGKEEEQSTVPEAAAQHAQHRQSRVGQEMETPVDKQDPALDFLTWGPPVAEQDAQHQTHFAETALHTDLRLGPGEAEGIQKTNRTGSDPTAPMGAEIPLPQSGTASFRRCLNTTPECGLPFGGKLEREEDSYVVETNSELLEDLQVASLKFPDPFETCVPESKRKKNTVKLARQHVTMSCRCTTRRQERLLISHVLDGRKSQRQQKRRKTKHPEQTKNFAAVFWDVIHSKVPILINTKMSSGLNGGRERQKITRLDHMQVMRAKSPSGREVCCPDYAEMIRFSNSVTEGKEVAGEHAGLPAPEASQDLLFNTCQKKDQGPMESNEEQKQSGSINVHVRPQTQLTPTILGSASFPLFYQFQLGEPEGLVRFSPPESREAKTDGIIVSAGECGIPSAANHGKEQQPSGTGEKERVTFNFYEPASATPTRKRNFEQDSDMRTSVNSACGIRKAHKPSVSCILSIKGGGSPHRGEEPRRDSLPNVEEMEPGKGVAASVSMFVCSAQDSGTYSKTGRGKDVRGEKRLCSQQVKRAITPHGGTVSAGETKEVILPDQKEEESGLETFLKNMPQPSQHFIFCSGPMEEFDPYESEGQEPDAPQHLQPVHLVQGELPDHGHQTQAGASWRARSQLHLLQSKEARGGQVVLAAVKYGLAGDGSCGEELNRDGRGDKAEAHKDRQDTVLESSDGPTASLPESDRQREMFTRRALTRRMGSRCVVMKARKAPASQILNILGSGRPRNLPPKTLKSPISGFLVHRKFSGAPEDRTIEQRGGTAPERPTTVLGSWDLPTLAFPISKGKRNNLKLRVKRSKMSLTCVTLKVKKAFLTFTVTRHGTSRHKRQFERNLKIMMQRGQPVAEIILNVISSLVPVARDVEVAHGTGVETESPWEMGVGAELLLQAHPTGGARAEAGGERARTSTRHPGGEASWEGAPLFPLHAHRVKEAGSVTADLELERSVRGRTPGSPAAARGPQGPALFAQSVVRSVSCCESVADTLSSPTLAASDDKIEMETHSTLNLDEPEGTPHSRAPLELEGPAHAWGAQKASSTDVRSRSSNTTRRKEQREKEEDDFPSTSPASAAGAGQHSGVRSLYVRNLGPCKSGLEQTHLEDRKTWNLLSVVQKRQQEKHIREMVLKPISRHVMDVLQVKTVKERPHTQEGKEGGAQLKTLLPKAGKSEAGLIQGRSPQDGDPRGRGGGPITKEKAWNQNDLLRTVLRALDCASLESSALRSQDYTLGRAGKRGLGPKHGPGKAKKPAVSRLRHTSRAPPGNHRRQQQHTLNKRKERQWSVGELLLCAPGGAWVLPPTSALDKLLFAPVARDTLCNRARHADLGGHTTEEKTEGEENSARTFLGPLDFLMPILSDSKGQQDTAQLSGEKITLTVKNKESPTSPVFKIGQHFTMKCRGKHGSNLKTKVKEMKPSRDVPEALPCARGPSDAPRHGRLVGALAGLARASHEQAAQPELQAAWRAAPAHAAFCIPEKREQRSDRAPESRVFTADLKSACTSVCLLPHTETGPPPGAWAFGEDASEKDHAPNKAKVRQKEECEQQASFGTSQKTPASELGIAQGRAPGPFRSEAPLMGPQGLKDLAPQETERDLRGQEAKTGVRGEFCPELSPYPETPLPPSGEQKKESEGARGRKEHPRGSPETLPASAALCPRDEVQIKPPWGRARESPTDRASDTQGKVGRPGLTDQMSARSAGRRARELFQRGAARKNKALQEAVSAVDYTPIAREIGSLIIENLGKATHGTPAQPASSSKPCLLPGDSPAHRPPAEDAHGVRREHAAPEARSASTEANARRGHSQKRGKRQDFANPRAGQQRLLVPCGGLLEHRPRPHSDSWILPHLVALAKRALSEVGRSAAAPVPSPAQTQAQSAMLPLEPREASRPSSSSFPDGRTSPEEAQVKEATPGGGCPREREGGRVQSAGAQQRALPKVRLPGLFVQSLAIYLPALSGSKGQKVRVDQGLEKAMWWPQRRRLGAKKSGFAQARHTTGYGPWSSRPGPQGRGREKLGRRRLGQGNPELAVASTCAFIPPLPHARRNPETARGQISNNGERTKQRMLREKQDGIKGAKLSLPLLPDRKDSPALLHIVKLESEAEESEGESDVEVASVRPCLPSLPRPHLNARAHGGEGKQRAARSCLPPHGRQASSDTGKLPLAEPVNAESVIAAVESKQHSLLRRKGDREALVRVNDVTGLSCVTFKGRRTHFKHILLANKPQQNQKEQEQMRQKDKTGPAVVQGEAQAATPHLPSLECGGGVRPKVSTRTVVRFCLPTLTRWELSTTVGMCEEPADDILSSIKKARYTSRKGEGGMEGTLEEIKCPRRAARTAVQPAYVQGFPWCRRDADRKTLREEYQRLRIQSKSCPSVSFLPYSEAVRRRKVKRIETKSCFLQPQTQKSCSKQKTACKGPLDVDASNSTEKAKGRAMQGQERMKAANALPLEKKKPASSQETQLVIKAQEEKTGRVTGQPRAVLTGTCTAAPSHSAPGPRTRKAAFVIEITKYSLPKQSHRKRNAVKKANEDPTRGGISSDVQEAQEHAPQKDEANALLSTSKDLLHPEDKEAQDKAALPREAPSSVKEQDRRCPGSAGQGRPDGTAKGGQEAAQSARLASESSAAHYEPGERTKGKEDTDGIARPAISQVQSQKSLDGGKVAQAEARGDRSDRKTAQKQKPQNAEDGADVDHVTSTAYPQGAPSRAEILPLPRVLRSPEGHAPPSEAQRRTQEGEHVRERKGGREEVPTKSPLPQLKVNEDPEGRGAHQGATRPSVPPSRNRELSEAGNLSSVGSPPHALSSNSGRTEDVTQRREDEANIFQKDAGQPGSAAVMAKPSTLSHLLGTETLRVSVTEHGPGALAGGRVRAVTLSKTGPCPPSSAPPKWSAVNGEAGEPGTSSPAAQLELQQPPPSGQPAPAAQAGGSIRRAECRPEEEKHRARAAPCGAGFKAEMSQPPRASSVNQPCAPSRSEEAEWDAGEKAQQEAGRAGDPEATLTETPPPPAPRSPGGRWTVTMRRELLAKTSFSLQSQLPKPSCAGEAGSAGPREGISSCNLTVKAIQCTSYRKAKGAEEMKENGRIFSKIMSLRAERPPFTHEPRRAPASVRDPEKDSRSGRGKGKPGAVLAEGLASFPSPSDLKQDIGRKEREDILGLTKPYFPPLRIQDPYSSGKRAHAKSSDRNVCRGAERRRAVDGLLPRHMDLQAKKFSLSHVLSTETLQWEIEAQESKLQEGKALVIGLKSICASLLALPYFQCDVAEERATLRIAKSSRSQLPCKAPPGKAAHAPTAGAELSSGLEKLEKCTLQEEEDSEEDAALSREAGPGDVDSETNKSPASPTWRQSCPLRKRKALEGKAAAGEREAGGVTPARTCASRAALLHRPGSAGVEQGGLPRLARPSFPSASGPASPEPETREISAPPHNARSPPPRGRPGKGAGRLRPRCQGKELQEGEGEPGVLPNTPSGSRPRPHLQADRGTQVDNDPPALWRSSRQRASKAGEVVPTELASAGALKALQNEEPREPQKEERVGERAADQRGVTPSTHITLKSTAPPRSAALPLHRTELHLRVPGRAQQQRQGQGQGHAPSGAPRQGCVSKAPPASPTLDKGTQVDERRLGVQRPSPLPPPPAALRDSEEPAGSEARGGDTRRGKQRWSQNRCALQTVDVNLRVRAGEARVSPLSRILEAKGLVLNVKTLTRARRTGDQEPRIFLTRAFLCTPAAAPLELNAGSTAGSTAPRVMGPAGPQGALRESPDAQRAAPGEAADKHGELAVKRGAPSCRGGVAPQQWTSDFLICLQGRKEPPPAKSKGGLRQMVLNSQDEDVYFSGFGTISSGKRLGCLFMGQKAQSEKYWTETLSPFLSCPTKRENREEENSDDRADAEGTPKETHRVPSSPVSCKTPSPPEPIAPPQETLSEAAPRSAHSDSSAEMPEEDGRRHHKVIQAASAKGPAAQTRGSQKEVKGAESSGSPKRKGPNVPTKEGVLLSEGGPQPGQNASIPIPGPLPNRGQQTPPGVDVCKAVLLRPRPRPLPGTQEQHWLAPQHEACILERIQNFLTPYEACLSADRGGINECGTRTIINLEQKKVKRERGKLKLGTNMTMHLQEKKMGEVSPKEKVKKGRSHPLSQKAPPLKAVKPAVQTQALAPLVKSHPGKQKHQEKLRGTSAGQARQPPRLFQKQVLDSLYAYIPLPPKFEGWKGRVTMADLKRELSPKYLTIKIPNHPVPQILDHLGRGFPSDRMKLEYDFTKPKVFLWPAEASGIAIRRLSIALVSPPQRKDLRVAERNQRGGGRIRRSESPGHSANTQEAPWSRDSCSARKEGGPGAPCTTPQDSQPFLVPEWKMQRPPEGKSEASLCRARNERLLTPQTKDRAVPRQDSPTFTTEPDSLVMGQERKAPESIPTPSERPFLSEAARERQESCVKSTPTLSLPPPAGEAAAGAAQLDHSSGCTPSPEPRLPEPAPGTGTPTVQPQTSFAEPAPAPHHVTGNEGRLAAEESFAALLEAIKSIFASQVNSMIQDKVRAEVRKQVRAHSSGAGESPPSAEPDPTCRAHPEEQPEAILGHFTAREKKRLTDHFKSKALEREGNLIPERVKQSSWKFSRRPEGALLVGEGGGGWRPLTPRGPGSRELILKRPAPGEAAAVSEVKNWTVGDSTEKILTNLKNIGLPPRRASLVPSAQERPVLSQVLQKFSIREREKLLVHFSLRTLEMQTESLPRIVRDSHARSSAQDRRRPLSNCSHPAASAPKRQKRIVLVFEEKSLHQIDLDLQYKYQRCLLGLPVERLFPTAKALPRYIPKLNPAARAQKADCRVAAGGLCVAAEVSGKRVPPKQQSPSPHAPSIRSVLAPAPGCASDPGPLGALQKGAPAPPKVRSSVPPGRERKCRVWFQETEACKPLASKLLGSAASAVGSRCGCWSECSPGTPGGLGNSADLDERPCRDVPGRRECALPEASRRPSRETACTPCGVQRGAPWQSLPGTPLLREAWTCRHSRSPRKHASTGTPPSGGSCRSKRSGASAQTRSSHGAPRGLRTEGGSGLSSPTSSSSCPATGSAAEHSPVPLTESNIKLHLASSRGRLPTPAEGPARKQAPADSRGRRPSRERPAGARSRSPRGEEPRPAAEPADSDSEERTEGGDRPPCPQQSAPCAPLGEASPRPEDEQSPPFFYACVPADSLEITPKTVRWAIPPRALRKRNFRLPLVAKVSSSCDLFSSSRNLLETFMESFSLVHQN